MIVLSKFLLLRKRVDFFLIDFEFIRIIFDLDGRVFKLI